MERFTVKEAIEITDDVRKSYGFDGFVKHMYGLNVEKIKKTASEGGTRCLFLKDVSTPTVNDEVSRMLLEDGFQVLVCEGHTIIMWKSSFPSRKSVLTSYDIRGIPQQ